MRTDIFLRPLIQEPNILVSKKSVPSSDIRITEYYRVQVYIGYLLCMKMTSEFAQHAVQAFRGSLTNVSTACHTILRLLPRTSVLYFPLYSSFFCLRVSP